MPAIKELDRQRTNMRNSIADGLITINPQ